jgi:cyclohexanecarboxylate-CoA ligase
MIRTDDVLLGPGSRFTPELVREYVSSGAWREKPLGDYLEDAADTWPDVVAALTIDPATGEARGRITYSEMRDRARRVAAGLEELGVGAGDVVAVMMPNGLEFSVLAFAVASLGAVYTGIPVTYGSHEATFEVMRSEAKVLALPARFRKRDLLELAREVRDGVPQEVHVVVIDGDVPAEAGWSSLHDLAAKPPRQPTPVPAFSLAQLGFTSGTTNEPKAVMNTHQTIDAMITNWSRHIGDEILHPGFVNLVMSPVGHSTGFFWGALMTAQVGGTAAYLEHWDPEGAVQAIERHRVNFTIGSPTFLLDLLRTDAAREGRLTSLTMVGIAGAPIPRSLVPRAREQLGCFICPAWGMTENGIGISARPTLPLDRVDATDGVVVAGTRVRIVDEGDEEVPAGVEGNLQITGSGLFAGYYARPDFTAEALLDGWLRTGDRAMIDADGFVTLTGRTKDIIIRGGENIPVAGVEDILYRHPAVAEVAVIALPDPRLGERACAVVELVPAGTLDFAAMREYLLHEGLSKRFLPERLEFVREMPKTPSGKIRKVELRERFAPPETSASLSAST